MPTPYAGANSFPADITIPSDGDAKPAASVNAAVEGLADRTQYLKAHGLIATAHYADNALAFTTASATYVDFDASFFTSIGSCQVGDVLLITLTAALSIVTATFTGTAALVVTDGGVDHVLPPQVIFGNVFSVSAPATPTTFTVKYVVTAAGTVSVRAQVKNDGTHGSNATAPASITVLQVRP